MKILGIGLSKTGTTSLSEALRILGFTTVHCPTSIDHILSHDAATDISVSCGFEFLDTMLPGSRFIYTIRPIDGWLASIRRHVLGYSNPQDHVRKLWTAMYGWSESSIPQFSHAWLQHKDRVERHFMERPGDLLTLNIFEGDGWPILCNFLDKPIPTVPFPHLNACQKGVK